MANEVVETQVAKRPDQLDPTTSKDDHRRASISTFSGVEFFSLNPRVEDIRILDIAHALSMKCRYTGHCHQFYSVAQHSIMVSEMLEVMKASVEVQYIGLMHDAQEAYLPDVASPLKGHIPGYREIETRVEKVVAEAFGFEFPHPKMVKVADAEAFKHEYKNIMQPLDWWKGDGPKYQWGPIPELDPFMGRERFIQRHRLLSSQRELT